MNEKMVTDNMNLVYYILHRYYPTFVTDEDIIQCGMLGLCKAAETYAADKGAAFSTYASTCIINEIRLEIRNRKKHSLKLSIDNTVKDDDGNETTYGDLLVGDTDVDISGINFQAFYLTLSNEERELVELLKSNSQREIAGILGISHQAVSQRRNKIRYKWRKFNGNN